MEASKPHRVRRIAAGLRMAEKFVRNKLVHVSRNRKRCHILQIAAFNHAPALRRNRTRRRILQVAASNHAPALSLNMRHRRTEATVVVCSILTLHLDHRRQPTSPAIILNKPPRWLTPRTTTTPKNVMLVRLNSSRRNWFHLQQDDYNETHRDDPTVNNRPSLWRPRAWYCLAFLAAPATTNDAELRNPNNHQ